LRDICVDIETTGTSPDRTAIIQIAAVKFDLLTGEVDHNFFNECLSIPPTRFWSDDTRSWWMRQKQAVLAGIFERMRDPGTVMNEFVSWAGYDNPRFWSKPLSFDYPFISSYCKDFGLHVPFSYREAMDCRSYLQGLAFPESPISERDIEFDGDAHNAIFDVLFQIKWLLANQTRFGSIQDAVSE
jgi:DNA polymerase III epsilon subunit-like protein